MKKNARILITWYNRDELGTARFSIELIPVLEALGCKIKTGGTAKDTKTVFQIGDREFTIYSSGELYDNKGLLCSDAAHPQNTIWRTGPLYFDDSNYKGVLSLLGFDGINCEVNENERVISLTATLRLD